MSTARTFPPEDELDTLFDEVNNAGRWGPDDELGTLNFITPDKRISAAGLALRLKGGTGCPVNAIALF